MSKPSRASRRAPIRAARPPSDGESALAAASAQIARAFRPGEASRILGLSRRQLQYWAQTDLAPPSITTRGGHHRYSFEDLVALRAAKRLLDAGVSVQRIRSSIQALRGLLPTVRRPLVELTLVATGDVVLVFHGGTAFEAVSGQEWVFEIARLQREIEAWQSEVARLGRREPARGPAEHRAIDPRRRATAVPPAQPRNSRRPD